MLEANPHLSQLYQLPSATFTLSKWICFYDHAIILWFCKLFFMLKEGKKKKTHLLFNSQCFFFPRVITSSSQDLTKEQSEFKLKILAMGFLKILKGSQPRASKSWRVAVWHPYEWIGPMDQVCSTLNDKKFIGSGSIGGHYDLNPSPYTGQWVGGRWASNFMGAPFKKMVVYL